MVLLLFYVFCFFLFYPRAITNDDEAAYLDQARLFAAGRATLPKLNPLTEKLEPYRSDFYPPGTALVMAPLIAIAGWRGAFLVPFLSVIVAVLVTARWLRDEGRSPIFALLLLGFPATLVMGRMCMSDVPSMAVISLGLWLFWRGLDRGWPYWLASGFVAGIAVIFRDTNAIVFAPVFVGTVIRREARCWALIAGGIAGLAVKLLANYLIFGDVLYLRSRYIVDLPTMGGRLTIYLLGLLICVPGGLILTLAYRGRRRPELIASALFFFAFFVIQTNTMSASAPSKRLILDWRYLLPVLPLVVLGTAEAAPRLWRQMVAAQNPDRREVLRVVARVTLVLWVSAVAASSFLVQFRFQGWSLRQAEIRDVIHTYTSDDSVLITNRWNTRKFLRNLERSFVYLDRDEVSPRDVATLVRRYGPVFLVFLDRNDASFRLSDAKRNADFVNAVRPTPEIQFDRQITPQDRLRIWRVVDADNR
jgi:4-amino-4-deoxy-L-arabinose transferase-like glycosyltransferase